MAYRRGFAWLRFQGVEVPQTDQLALVKGRDSTPSRLDSVETGHGGVELAGLVTGISGSGAVVLGVELVSHPQAMLDGPPDVGAVGVGEVPRRAQDTATMAGMPSPTVTITRASQVSNPEGRSSRRADSCRAGPDPGRSTPPHAPAAGN